MMSWLRFLKDELRLAVAPDWSGGVYHNRPTPAIFTRQDPRCRVVEIKQRAKAQELRREGVVMRAAVSSAWEHDERAFRFLRRA